MTHGEVLVSGDGWTLTQWSENSFPYGEAGYLPGPRWWALSGLRVTLGQARAICQGRAAYSVDYRGDPPYLLDLTVTQAEAVAIAGGKHPLAVLMPALHARPLTRQELMRR